MDHGKAFACSRYRVSAFLLLVFALLSCVRVEGAYANLGNDRVLLMNNDSRPALRGRVENQGYYDTNSTIGVTYWTHNPQDDNTMAATRYLLHGTEHVLHAADGSPLWHLIDCRAGYVQSGNATRNYIPWSETYAQKSGASIFKGAGRVRYYTNEVNACVFMRNTPDAVIYSPYYEERIGTIYADVVNSYVRDSCTIVLEIATNVTAVAAGAGVTFSTAGTDYDKYDWQQTPMTVLSVENGNIASISDDVEILTLDATEGGTTHYFRIRTQLNYYAPIRFRIRRTSHNSGEDADTSGLIALDNIIASYPPMTIRLERYGEDYDTSLKGAEVLGCMGDFNVPFLSTGAKGVRAKAKFSWVTNNADVSQKIELSSPQFHYRWRYLNQMADDWKVLPLTPTAPSYLVGNTATQLVSEVDIPLNQGAGDIEYFFTADVDAQYYAEQDYANDVAVGFGDGWTEKISAVTNRATYTETDRLPSCGTDYFTRVREGESNVGWVQLVGTLTVTNKVAGSNEVVRLHTPDGTAPRMTLVGDHIWRYHYQIPTNGVGGTLAFHLITKEHYTNETDATQWLIRTNTFYTTEKMVAELPFAAMLHDGSDSSEVNDISLVFDDAATHLKIEYNDQQNTFSLSHATYQDFNMWTDATEGFCGNMMETNGYDVVSNSGVSGDKQRYDAPFDKGDWELCPERNARWREDFTMSNAEDVTAYPTDTLFSVHKTPNDWTAYNSCFLEGARGEGVNLALALDGRGKGALALDNVAKDDLPLGLDSVEFTARIAQPIEYDDFATYRDGYSCKNYAISAMVTMSRQKETDTKKPSDMSPTHPSLSFVGYHRGTQGCYEFRMTRKTDTSLELELYKWTSSGSSTTCELLTSKIYTSNLLLPTSDDEVSYRKSTAAYFLVYTLSNGTVKLEGHLSSERTQPFNGVTGTEAGLSASAITWVDNQPGELANGGTYGVGSIDCRAGFGAIKIHDIQTPPTADTDGRPFYSGYYVGHDCLEYEWDFYTSRWEVDSWAYNPNGGLSAVIPSSQVIQVWLADATVNGSPWFSSGYEEVVNSFSTNKFMISPRMPGSWKVMLKTGEEDVAVVVDDVEITPWEGENRWGRRGYAYLDDWVYTKGWITEGADTTRICTLQPSRGRDGYPMGLRTPYIDQGLSYFSYSYKNADSNCVLLVQIATNMVSAAEAESYIPSLTESIATNGNGQVWTTVARYDFSRMTDNERRSGTHTTFIGLRQHWIYDFMTAKMVYTNVCGAIRVIVDPAVVSKVVNAPWDVRDAMVDYGKITISEAHCYNEPALNIRSWFGFNVYTEGWDGLGNAGRFAYLTDWPDGLSIALNYSAKKDDNTHADALGIDLAETDSTEVKKYKQQNPFIQCAALTNGIGTVSFRARLFDTNKTSAVVTLYGGTDPSMDQPTTEFQYWKPITNFVVTTPTYQAFEWNYEGNESPYQTIRLEAAGARWGRYPSWQAGWWNRWEWLDLTDASMYGASVQEPINRVFIDDVSVSEVMHPATFSIFLSLGGTSTIISEADEGSNNCRINVNLGVSPSEPITVKLDIERALPNSTSVLPVLSANTIDFVPGQKEAYVYLTELDGSAMSEFRVVASVTNETVNVNGVRWCDLYEHCELPISIVNHVPYIWGMEPFYGTWADVAHPQVPVTFLWNAEDALADMTNGLFVTITTSDGYTTNFPIATVETTIFRGTNEVVFSSEGMDMNGYALKTVTLKVEDKDGGMNMKTLYFYVVPPVEFPSIEIVFGGKAEPLSTEWIGWMLDVWPEWVVDHQTLTKSILEATAANGRLSVVECYALGLDPEVATDDLVITELPMKADGTPDLAKLKYEPSEDRWTLPGLTARVLGASDLAGPWQEVRVGDETHYRFFKVVIEVP